jgi:hypothetical protein
MEFWNDGVPKIHGPMEFMFQTTNKLFNPIMRNQSCLTTNRISLRNRPTLSKLKLAKATGTALVAKVLDSLFVMAAIKAPSMSPKSIRHCNQRLFIFAVASIAAMA